MLPLPSQNKPFFHRCSLHPDTAGIPHGDAEQVINCLLMEEGQIDASSAQSLSFTGDIRFISYI